MNGFYQRKIQLPIEELRPLEIYELEFVSDLNESAKPRGDPTKEKCPRCESTLTNFKIDPYCMNCLWDSVENKTNDQRINDDNEYQKTSHTRKVPLQNHFWPRT